jgi:signal transduction histidine kinase
VSAVLAYLPRGNTLSDEAWNKRHLLLQWLLLLHVPGLFLFGLALGHRPIDVAETVAVPFACLVLGRVMRTRRLASFFITAGLVFCSAALVGLSGGSIEAHFHFFIMIGFIALYQDWVPFLWNIVFTVLSHGFGSAFRSDLIFNHHAGIAHPWSWSVLHGVAVLAACIGVVLFWKQTEDEQRKTIELRGELAASELGRRRFTADLLVNLARRNQNLLYRQLDLLNQLEDNERDPDALADLFRLDHLATRIRRNAESLLVLSGEEPARKWGRPVPLTDVIRAAIAETEDLDRVDFAVDESLAVSGRAVADLTHLLAELIENAVHFSPPGVGVMLRSRPYLPSQGAQVLTIEDWGVGMRPHELAEANELLASPHEVDLSMSQRLGLHVVARLARRYAIGVSLTQTPGGGVTAVVVLPAGLFAEPDLDAEPALTWRASSARMPSLAPSAVPMAPSAAPAEPSTATITVAPVEMAQPSTAHGLAQSAVPLRPQPALPPAVSVPAVPPVAIASRTAELYSGQPETSEGWHSWWTPHQQANGSPAKDGHGEDPAQSPAGQSPAKDGHGEDPTQSPAGQSPAGQSPAGQSPAGQSPAGQSPAGQSPAGQSLARAQSLGDGAAGGAQDAGPRDASLRGAGGSFGSAVSEPGGADGPQLSQRVPQANLVEGLRRMPSGSEQPQPLRDPEQAREALSRFQASQRAARAALSGGSVDDPGNPNGSGDSDDRRR